MMRNHDLLLVELGVTEGTNDSEGGPLALILVTNSFCNRDREGNVRCACCS